MAWQLPEHCWCSGIVKIPILVTWVWFLAFACVSCKQLLPLGHTWATPITQAKSLALLPCTLFSSVCIIIVLYEFLMLAIYCCCLTIYILFLRSWCGPIISLDMYNDNNIKLFYSILLICYTCVNGIENIQIQKLRCLAHFCPYCVCWAQDSYKWHKDEITNVFTIMDCLSGPL